MVQKSVLSEKEYSRDVTEFAKLSTGDVWTLHKTSLGIIAKQSAMCRFGDQILNRQANFAYNRKLGRLELWFMFYSRNGRPLRVCEFASILGTDPVTNDSIVIELSTHPQLQIPYYKLYENPDATSNFMSGFEDYSINYIDRWLLAFGAEAGYTKSGHEASISSCSQSVASSVGS